MGAQASDGEKVGQARQEETASEEEVTERRLRDVQSVLYLVLCLAAAFVVVAAIELIR